MDPEFCTVDRGWSSGRGWGKQCWLLWEEKVGMRVVRCQR